MPSILSLSIASLGLVAALPAVLADDAGANYSACPLIRAYYPPPTISKSSKTFTSLVDDFTSMFDKLVQDGGSEKYGPISANTTSFSVVLFGGADSLEADPIFFEYYYTSPEDLSTYGSNITADTKFPAGDLTMVFSVYAWLVRMGDQWETPITHFLPELKGVKGSFSVPWKDVTIGALAGQMSGLSRESYACSLGESCDWKDFVHKFAKEAPVFLPDTTPVVSYAAFQLLAFAMEKNSRDSSDYSKLLDETIFGPLNMSNTSLLSNKLENVFAIDGLNLSQHGEPAALSLVTTISDLARAGHAMLSSKLISPAETRRWFQPTVDTSNLVNGVGRPWEVYRAAESSISPVLDVLTKSGTLGQYASYFGLTPDMNAGFAILAHDASVADRKLDLNVYADIVSEVLVTLQEAAAKETALRYTGEFQGDDSSAIFNISDNGPGLAVEKLLVSGVDLRAEVAGKLGIKAADLDFKLYPTNVQDTTKHQWIAVFQDMSAPADQGTPTCITWQEVGAVAGIEDRFIFELDKEGMAGGIVLPGAEIKLQRGE